MHLNDLDVRISEIEDRKIDLQKHVLNVVIDIKGSYQTPRCGL